MEMIKDIVKQFYPLMIAVSCVLFVIWIFFPANSYNRAGVFESGGKLFQPVVNTREIKSEGIDFIKDTVSGFVPVAKYTGGVKTIGEFLVFKEQLQVMKADGSWVNGSLEDEFSIYLLDIRNKSGNSVMVTRRADEIAGMEEIPAPFVYEKEQDMLCCFGNGIYTVTVKIYGANGGMAIYEFHLPVEVG